MLTIITPCCRQTNLQKLYESIQFDKIDKWFIVYDTTNDRKYSKVYESHPKIVELECNDPGISGNAQRNYGMTFVKDGWIYFLDDDNIIHENFWNLINSMDSKFIYTFNQVRYKIDNTNDYFIMSGKNIKLKNI